MEELIALLLTTHNVTAAVRQQCVYIFWREMVEARIADKTTPESISNGVLKISTTHSVWVQELRFFKAQMIEQINRWVEAQRVWLGPQPLVSDIRITLGTQREPLVDPDHLRRLRQRHARRLRSRSMVPPVASDSDQQAIRAETSAVEDDDLRAAIENVRLRWNR